MVRYVRNDPRPVDLTLDELRTLRDGLLELTTTNVSAVNPDEAHRRVALKRRLRLEIARRERFPRMLLEPGDDPHEYPPAIPDPSGESPEWWK